MSHHHRQLFNYSIFKNNSAVTVKQQLHTAEVTFNLLSMMTSMFVFYVFIVHILLTIKTIDLNHQHQHHHHYHHHLPSQLYDNDRRCYNNKHPFKNSLNISDYEVINPRIAVGFFGVSRNLSSTIGSIERHVFDVLDRNNIRFVFIW